MNAVSMNARRDVRLAGYIPLSAPPRVGATIVIANPPDWRPTMVTVAAVRDHRPVDGPPERDAVVELHDGTWDFWWNCYEGD